MAVARLAHRGARFAAGAALEDAWRDSRVGGELAGILEQRQIRQLGDEVSGALFPDPFDADDEFQGAGAGGPIQPILDKISEMEYNSLIPIEETIRILEPEEEWHLLSSVIGDDLVAKIRAAQALEVAGEEAVNRPEIPQAPRAEESPSVDTATYHPDDYKDFPAKWEI